MADHNEFGKIAEDLAAEYLSSAGYTLLSRNFRFQRAEIDIVAKYGDLLVVVEVKARSYSTVIEPQEAVNRKKIRSIVQCTDFFMNENSIDSEVRFDIITIVPNESGKLQLNHIEDAFQSFDAQ